MPTTIAPSTTTTTWQIDASHSSAQFAVRHLMISTVKGRFAQISGSATVDPTDPGRTIVDVSIPVASIDTHDEKRDAHLRSADFFDVERHPNITFKGSRIEGDIDGDFTLAGALTIRGVTRDVALKVTNEGVGSDPWGNDRMGFSATGKINRTHFGLLWNVALEAGGVLVGEDVKLTIDVEFMRPTA